MKNRNLILIALLIVGLALVGIGLYSIFKPAQPNQTQSTTQPQTSSSPCQPIVYPSGSRWICGKPTFIVCRDLGQVNSSVKINGDTAVVVVPANESHGVEATGFQINKGDKLDISVSGRIKFSNDHPCVDGSGMAGWEDPEVDSPFRRNVGGLEFSIGSLYDNRYFVGNHYQGVAETGGVPIFRVIERSNGYIDNNSGAFTVTVQKIK